MATKKELAPKKTPAPAPAAPPAGNGAQSAKPQANNGAQSSKPQANDAGRAKPKAAPPLETKGSSRGTTSHKSPDEIAKRAYELWLQRGAPHGGDQDDWHRAERELDGPSRH